MIKYDNNVIKVLKQSEKEAYQLNSSIVTINHFILASLKIDNNIKNIFNKFNINYQSFINEIKVNKEIKKNSVFIYSLELKKILDLSYDTANKYQSSNIKLEHIFITLLDENLGITILRKLNLNLEAFYKDLINSFNTSDSLLSDIGVDLTELAKSKKFSNIVGRDKEIKQLIEILARKNKNNPILLGEAGVGKTAIVEELSNLISSKNIPNFLKNKKIISISISSIISGTKYRGEFEEKLNKIIKECENRNDIILFIDEIHTIVGAGGAEGAIDASNILKPALARGTLKLIGATTTQEYKKTIAKDKALDRRFQKIIVNIPTKEETYYILKNIKKDYENFHNVNISNNLLKIISDFSDKYILDRNNPDKSIDILDEACANTSVIKDCKIIDKLNKKMSKINKCKEDAIKNNEFNKALKYKEEEQKLLKKIQKSLNIKKEVSINTIIEIIEAKCNSKIYDMENYKLYEHLKNNLNKKIIGQKNQIDKIIDRLKLLNQKKDDLPISFLIKGPTGTGKTYFALELAKLTNKNLIKLNMNDYQNEIAINKIIGSPQGYVGYDDNNTIFEELKLNPNSIILLDEIDKANNNIINLFSKILSEGILKNSKNEVINFKNTIIVMTLCKKSDKSIGYINNTQLDDGNFNNSDLVNNINYVTNFNELNKNDIIKIIDIELEKLNNNFNMNISLSPDKIENIINKISYKKNGAKEIKNTLKIYFEESLIAINTL